MVLVSSKLSIESEIAREGINDCRIMKKKHQGLLKYEDAIIPV